MAENAELQAKIAALAGRINRHKAVEAPPANYHVSHYAPEYERGSHTWASHRGTPYGIPRGRGWSGRLTQHRNRTLVVNGPGQSATGDHAAATPATDSHSANENQSVGWVSKRDRHMQLINTSVYEQKSQERLKAMAETRKQKAQRREQREKWKVNMHLRSLAGVQHLAPYAVNEVQPVQQMIINDITYLVTEDGSKLIKAPDVLNMTKTTPKRADVGGVVFLRSKHGNLYRAGFVKTKRRADMKKISKPCQQFTITGTCSKGPGCWYEHDPDKVAICRDFLQTGKCQAGLDCDLSHNPTAERVPACVHFIRGNCTNPDCRYAHVRTNPGAPVCRAFATLGFCSKGTTCEDRHVFECPDFANKGICRNESCRLPHVHRAGQLRKAAAVQNTESDEGASSDISSDDELAAYDSDDVDSDEFDEDFTMPDVQNHELSQQVDYVKF